MELKHKTNITNFWSIQERQQ